MLVGEATVPVAPPPLMVTPGVPALEKKPNGYVSVMLLPVASAPPAVVVKANVAAEPVLLATRSAAPTVNVTAATAPPITPDVCAADARASTLVCTVTEPPALAAPMVRPVSVTVTAVPAASAVPEVVMTMKREPGCPGVRVAPAVESEAEGAADPKKPDG